jgi:hypothetical protein
MCVDNVCGNGNSKLRTDSMQSKLYWVGKQRKKISPIHNPRLFIVELVRIKNYLLLLCIYYQVIYIHTVFVCVVLIYYLDEVDKDLIAYV